MSLFFNYKYKISEVVVKLKNQKVKPAYFISPFAVFTTLRSIQPSTVGHLV